MKADRHFSDCPLKIVQAICIVFQLCQNETDPQKHPYQLLVKGRFLWAPKVVFLCSGLVVRTI